MKPLVSVIITTHDRAALLGRAIESVLKQTYINIEIIIVDDHSTDNTQNISMKYANSYSNVYYYALPDDMKGACAARNYGILKSKGEYISGLDDDDEYMPNRIELLLSKMKSDHAFVFSSWIFCVSGEDYPHIPFKKEKVITKKDLYWSNYVGNQILVRKDDIIKAGGFDLHTPCYQDWDMWLRLLDIKDKALYIPEPLQILYVDKGRKSITKVANQKEGLDNIYIRTSKDMSYWQKHFFHYREYRKYGKRFSLPMILSCFAYFLYKIKQ